MINGFNLAPLSQVPPPLCWQGEPDPEQDCRCYPRPRQGLTFRVPRNGMIKATPARGYTAIICPNNTEVSWGGDHPTAADVQLRPFVVKGAVYIKIIDGRVGRIITTVYTVILSSGQIESLSITLEII